MYTVNFAAAYIHTTDKSTPIKLQYHNKMSAFARGRILSVTLELVVVEVFDVYNIVSVSRSGACGVGSVCQ